MELLDGKKLALEIEEDLKKKISQLPSKPCLAVVLVGDNPASEVYVRMKTQSCERIGIESRKHNLPKDISEEELLKLVKELNEDKTVNGILVQLPLPNHIDEKKVIESISALKDIDGFHPMNTGWLYQGKPCFVPCTPRGIIRILKEYKIDLKGKNVVIIGRSNIVGKPVANLFLQENSTITICHTKTKDIKAETLKADIIVVAVGVPNLLKADMVPEGAIVVDVGMNRVEDKTSKKGFKLCGDVDFENVKDKTSYITPVPKGVGPMTVAMLMENTYEAYCLQNEL